MNTKKPTATFSELGVKNEQQEVNEASFFYALKVGLLEPGITILNHNQIRV